MSRTMSKDQRSPNTSREMLTGQPERGFGLDFAATAKPYPINLHFASKMWSAGNRNPAANDPLHAGETVGHSREERSCDSMRAFEQAPRITPFLWFEANAEEAVDYYLSVFKNSRKLSEFRNPGGARAPEGAILTIAFELDGTRFTALNGGSEYKFNEAVSFVVRCDSQEEVDYYWSRLTDGGSEIACGWLRDKFGLCWQIVPARLMEWIRHPKAMQAMMTMKKLDIAELERAARE